ncbi:tripartite tricarboxylate transporter permease [Aurantimonas sp. C2-6-R+9]|uniref:tripartite tricarboxylate transporter permease n=1 Tax=unclassified Aurantimonas TaxID=2638230 RepID=UPI002E18AE75|nr:MULTISPECIES: tripartite tricarboxylate transporter permease [unclassified Aurantimonas]MEC5290860.1 tripartite tricarboxylate transporter permease [Aurantimonas sp. C2-3-R2]MEC5381037.1 tripartite tricarboxylate transporter permease [Aurantimonas sp. C2-6-R+9]MEC5412010.1 tripartite tricarboxylate transporter permease [Aurantimonas sp. C2-4-R8]
MQNLRLGIEAVFTWQGLLAIFVGTALGIVVGALPGLGPSLGVALLIPATFSLSPSVGFNLLVSLYIAAEYGGSISAILIGTPGTAAATATVVDGYPMNRQGRGALALQTSLSASTFGGVVGAIALIVFSQPLVVFVLQFGPPEYFALGLFGLTLIASLSGDTILKGLAAGIIGLLLAVVGVDPISGTPRYTGSFFELYEGIPFLAVLIGVFALAEAFTLAERDDTRKEARISDSGEKLGLRGAASMLPTFLRGSAIGTVIGAIPGPGANIAGWLAYDQERRWSDKPETFGKGQIKGVAAPEAANSASVGGALMPLLTLGLPGSPTTAVLIGALIIHGLQPGPRLFAENPDVVYGLFVGMLVAFPMLFVLGTAAMPLWRKVLALPNSVLAVGIVMLSLVGTYALRNLMFDVWLALLFGIGGYFLKKLRFPMAPLVLAMVLGAIVESNYARSLIMSQGSHGIFFERPLSIALILVAAAALVWPLVSLVMRRWRAAGAA